MRRKKPEPPVSPLEGIWKVGLAVLAIALLALISYDFSKPERVEAPEIEATMVGVRSHETEEGSYVTIIVDLPDGRRVPAQGLGLAEYQEGAKVHVQEYRSSAMGVLTYRLVRDGE